MTSMIRWHRPTLSEWPDLGRLTDLRDEIDRLFEAPLGELGRTSQLLSGWTPALDVYEDKDGYTIRAELAGMKKEDIEVSLHDGCVTLAGERRPDDTLKDAEVCRSERFFGRFQRTVTLPGPVAADKVKAHYQDGILTVTLPKTEEAKPKQIEVSVN